MKTPQEFAEQFDRIDLEKVSTQALVDALAKIDALIAKTEQQATSFESWAEFGDIPIRLKHHNPTTLPRRWQTPMR